MRDHKIPASDCGHAAGSCVEERGLTLLLVEDDLNDVMLIRRSFDRFPSPQSGPVQLHWVTTGIEAVRYLTGEGQYADRHAYPLPAILILDLKLPRMNGFELLDWLKSHQRFADIPVLVVSSSGEPEDISKARELGAAEFLVKSAAFMTLPDSVQRLSK
jgi:CheY-like chemotaxis protein